jgi:hypothetical protein
VRVVVAVRDRFVLLKLQYPRPCRDKLAFLINSLDPGAETKKARSSAYLRWPLRYPFRRISERRGDMRQRTELYPCTGCMIYDTQSPSYPRAVHIGNIGDYNLVPEALLSGYNSALYCLLFKYIWSLKYLQNRHACNIELVTTD